MDKVQTTIVIGNGFDQDLGRGTSYKDFVNSADVKFAALRTHLLSQLIEASNRNWIDLELELRNAILKWYNHGKKEDFAKEINVTWLILNRALFDYFFRLDNNPKNEINTNSCAYVLLQKLQRNYTIYSFNYFNPFYDKGEKSPNFDFVHGEYVHDDFSSGLMIMSQWSNMGFGVDRLEMESVIGNNEDLKPIIKHSQSDLQEALRRTNNVIIFGHSLGITDCDYFKPAFEEILMKNSPIRRITIITLNKDALNKIKESTLSWGIDLDKVSQCVPIKYIYTEKGANDIDFMELLATL
ncbi:AbiH family protein [Bacteroides thetaiotaomicron]|uniref:AbiH family protein n=1 Tax=Bacteroides thetaiotaomicron TaxID=818 RepID=UPI0039C4844E